MRIKRPPTGTPRIIRKLFIFPKTLNGETRFLEYCPVVQILHEYTDAFRDSFYKWTDEFWVEQLSVGQFGKALQKAIDEYQKTQ